MDRKRYLIVTADDFGIGPATSQGILDLALRKRVTATVLLVNSPHAEAGVRAWRRAGQPVEIGWHPCLTLDRPVLPARQVPSLVGPDGCFWPLGRFIARLCLGRIQSADVEAELRAQYGRFHDLVGRVPRLVNAHHHVHVLPIVGRVLGKIMQREQGSTLFRRVQEPWRMLAVVPGARLKRTFLSLLGRCAGGRCQAGFPRVEWLAGITDPAYVADPNFLVRWLTCMPGNAVEWSCHPGHYDSTLLGRDATLHDGQLQRRVDEFRLLAHPSFMEACRRANWTLVSPSEYVQLHGQKCIRAA